MRMRTTLMLGVSLVLWAAASPAQTADYSQPTPPPEQAEPAPQDLAPNPTPDPMADPATAASATGVVVTSSPSSLVIETDTDQELTFTVDANSTVPESLATGTRVAVQYHTMSGGDLHAAEVSRLEAPAVETSAATETEAMEEESMALPATASSGPAFALTGLLAAVAVLVLKASRVRAAGK